MTAGIRHDGFYVGRFDIVYTMKCYIPGAICWLERERTGNADELCFVSALHFSCEELW